MDEKVVKSFKRKRNDRILTRKFSHLFQTIKTLLDHRDPIDLGGKQRLSCLFLSFKKVNSVGGALSHAHI